MPPMKQVNLRIPTGLYAVAEEIAEDEGHPVASFLSSVIVHHMRMMAAHHANQKAAEVMDSMTDMLDLQRHLMAQAAASEGWTLNPSKDDLEAFEAVVGEQKAARSVARGGPVAPPQSLTSETTRSSRSKSGKSSKSSKSKKARVVACHD